MRVIAVGGEPGTGKTTLVKRIVQHYNCEPRYEDVKLVPFLKHKNLVVLGRYEEGQIFAGTDRMSLAVQPEAVKFMANLPPGTVVLYEGDRLFNSSFLEHCVDRWDVNIIQLVTDFTVREERYAKRGSAQNETWLAGRATKVANITNSLVLNDLVERFPNNNLTDQKFVFERIIQQIDGGLNGIV